MKAKKGDRRNVKKIFLFSGIGLVFIFLISYPLIVGRVVEKLHLAILEKVKTNLEKQLTVNSQLEKGGLSSQISAQVTIKGAAEAAPPPAFLVKMDISHLTGKIQTEVSIDPEKGKGFQDSFQNPPVLSVSSHYFPFLGVSNQFQLTPFKTRPSQGKDLNLDFEGLKGNLKLDSTGTPEFFEVSLKGLTLKEGLRIRKFEEFGLITSLDSGMRTVDFGLEFFFDKYDDLNELFGPGILNIQIKNLDSESLTKIRKMFSEFQQTFGKVPNEDLKMKMMMAVMGILPNFTRHSPSFQITHLKLRTKDGDLQGSAKVGIRNSGGGMVSPSFLSNVGVAVEGSAPQKVVHSLVDQLLKINELKKVTDQEALKGKKGQELMNDITAKVAVERKGKIQELVTKNYLVEGKNGYIFRFEFKNGAMTLNDRPFTLKL